EVEVLVDPQIRREVQADVEEREQPDQPPEADEVGHAEELAQRRDRERRDDQVDRPIAGEVLDVLFGIRGQLVMQNLPRQLTEGRKANEPDQRLGPRAFQHAVSNTSASPYPCTGPPPAGSR